MDFEGLNILCNAIQIPNSVHIVKQNINLEAYYLEQIQNGNNEYIEYIIEYYESNNKIDDVIQFYELAFKIFCR